MNAASASGRRSGPKSPPICTIRYCRPLHLIQRNAQSPREVARLARGQERELRGLLYGEATAKGLLAERLATMAAEVDDAYSVTVDVVIVGDTAVDDQLTALIAATREATGECCQTRGCAGRSRYTPKWRPTR